jgi:GNAT superfamily N-acetyltransferase
MSDDLTIRTPREDELDIVASVMVDAYAEYAEKMSPDAWSAFAHNIANVRGVLQDAELLVAERGGRIVGVVTLFTDWRGAQADAYGVRGLGVPPAERGTGVAHALMSEVIRRAREAGKQRVVLTVTQEMQDARGMFHRLGFERDPGLDHEPAPGVRAEGYSLLLNEVTV